MIRIALRILSAKKRKNLLTCLAVAFCILFILIVNAVYVGYSNVQIENGYNYGGKWDIAVKVDETYQNDVAKSIKDMIPVGTINNTFSARLDVIPEDKKEGNYAVFADHYYLSLLGIGSVKDNVLSYELLEGNWPKNDNEIVIPQKFEYNGTGVVQGSIKVGDRISLEIGRRIKNDGTITQDQIEDSEAFTEIKVKEYTVSGIMKYENYTTGNYVSYGYVGMVNTDAKASGGEVVTKYYKLNKLNLHNLQNDYKRIHSDENVIKVEKNYYIENALNVIYNTDLMKSVKYGLYIFEVFILLLGFGIICVNQYQNINEDKKQLILLHSVGAEQKHICYIYYIQNLIVGLIGLAIALLLFIGSKRIIYSIFTAGMRSKHISSGILAVNKAFVILVLVTTLFGMLCMARILIQREFSKICVLKNRQKKRKSISSSLKKRAPIKSIFELALNNIKFARARNRILMLIFTIIIIVLSVGIPICLSAYDLSVKASKAATSSDFYVVVKDVSDKLDKELDQIDSISSYYRVYTTNRWCYFPAKIFGDKIVAHINEQYPQTEGNSYKPFNDKNEYVYSSSIISVNEKYYEKLKQMNDNLPSYKEFASGDNCMIFGLLYLSAEDKSIDVGKLIGDNMESIDLYIDRENSVKTHLQIQSIMKGCLHDVFDDYVSIEIFVPENLYLEKMRQYSNTLYHVNGYSGRTDELGEQLKLLSQKESVLMQDNVSESSAAKDSLTIQYISIAVGMIMMVLLGSVSVHVIMKADYISRTGTYISYRTLGLERSQAVFLQFAEQIISLVNAILLSTVMLVIISSSILRGVFAYYEIGLNDVAIIMLTAILLIVLLILWNAVKMSSERYKSKISSSLKKAEGAEINTNNN